MPTPKQILDRYGPFGRYPIFRDFAELSERAYGRLDELRGGPKRVGESPTEFLITRLCYLAETTSVAIRLNASWALSLPAMSLTRDRYEQAVRFSWLARQTDNEQIAAFFAFYYAKTNKVMRGVSDDIRKDMADQLKQLWMTETPTKEERDYLGRWESLDLHSMAKKRDALPSKVKGKAGDEPLADQYVPIYQQFSSVSHGDMYAVKLVELQEVGPGQLTLAPNPNWPFVLTAQTSLFDIIQCHEALAMLGKHDTPQFDDLCYEWHGISDRMK